MRSVMRFLTAALAACLLCVLPAHPQAKSGSITGVVKDPAGGVIPGAQVEVFNDKTGNLERRVSTGGDGVYVVTLLPPGTYKVQIDAPGFKQFQAVSVAVRIGEATRQDASLQVGQKQETIVVEGAATLINTSSSATGQPIDQRTLNALPLPVPNFMLLLTLSPGTAAEPAAVTSANRGNVDINVNGQRTTNNSVTLEGVNVNDLNLAHFDTIPLPNPSTVQEFKVATSLYDASQGTKGGGALNIVLRSGTKDLHWEAYWFHRNTVLNANDWFRNRNGLDRAVLLQNVVGVGGSGPAWGIGGTWYVNVHGLRGRNGIDPNGASLNPRIPKLSTNQDGTTSAALLAAQFGLMPNQIDPIAVNILNLPSTIYGGTFLIPRPGQAGCPTLAAIGSASSFLCTFSNIVPLTDNQHTATYDRPLWGGKEKMSVRWFWDNFNANRPYGTASSLAFPQSVVQNNRFLSIGHTHMFTSRQLNEFRFGFSRFISSFAPSDSISLSDIGATRPNGSSLPGMYQISITGLFSLGTGVNDDRGTVSNQFHWSDTWSMVVGRHTLKAGGEIIRYQLNRFNRFASRGSLGFTSLASFLQGIVTSKQSAAGDSQRYFRATDAALFYQDDWRIHPRLTLNLGVRWELIGFSHDKFYKGGIYDMRLAQQTPPRDPFLFAEQLNIAGFTGTPGVTDCTLATCYDKNNFGPRVGFSWDVRGNQKTVVRAGYGIYFQRLSNQNILQGSLAAPFFVQLIDSTASAPLSLQDPLGNQPATAVIDKTRIPQLSLFAGTTGGANINLAGTTLRFVNQQGQLCSGFGGTAVNCGINLGSYATAVPNTKAPYTQQWNLSIQRDLWWNWAAEIGYVGSHYVGGIGTWDPFLAPLASPTNPIVVTDTSGATYTITTNTINNQPARHRALGFSRSAGARQVDNIGFATYHSAQLTLSRRFAHGLFVQGAYTFSKNIDNVSGSLSTDELNATRAGQLGANIFRNDPRTARALSDFDRPHRLAVVWNWEIRVPKHGIWGTQIFQGWGFSGVVTYQNGLPFTITDSDSGRAFGNSGGGTGLLVCRPAEQQLTGLPGCIPGTPSTISQALLPGSVQSRLDHWINPNFFSNAPLVPDSAASAACVQNNINTSLIARSSCPTGYGNIPRNVFRAPFQSNWDLAIVKNFTVRESHKFQFRAEFFNAFNHPVFQTPSVVSINSPITCSATLNNSPVTCGTAGSTIVSRTSTFSNITSTAVPARLIQFALKYSF